MGKAAGREGRTSEVVATAGAAAASRRDLSAEREALIQRLKCAAVAETEEGEGAASEGASGRCDEPAEAVTPLGAHPRSPRRGQEDLQREHEALLERLRRAAQEEAREGVEEPAPSSRRAQEDEREKEERKQGARTFLLRAQRHPAQQQQHEEAPRSAAAEEAARRRAEKVAAVMSRRREEERSVQRAEEAAKARRERLEAVAAEEEKERQELSAWAAGRTAWEAGTLLFEVLGAVLPMQLETAEELRTPWELMQVWEEAWGVAYAKRLRFSAQPEDARRWLQAREDTVPAAPAVTRLSGPASTLQALALELTQRSEEARERSVASGTRRQRDAHGGRWQRKVEDFKFQSPELARSKRSTFGAWRPQPESA